MGTKARQLLLHPLCAQKPDNYCCIHYGHKSQTITVASALVVTGSCFVEIQRLFKLQGQRNKEWSWVRSQLCFRLWFPRESCWASGVLVQYCSNKVNSDSELYSPRIVIQHCSVVSILVNNFATLLILIKKIFLFATSPCTFYIFSNCLFKSTVLCGLVENISIISTEQLPHAVSLCLTNV